MNTLVTDAMPGTAAPIALDMVRAVPRRVVGFSTVIETGLDDHALRTSLETMASSSAFTLDNLTLEAGSDASMARMIRAEFALTASRGTVGDPQIFALLRDIGTHHRWNGMEKHLER
ncbi:MAG: hypothetical protein AAF615_03405 [Pseudomonadota bacterium]